MANDIGLIFQNGENSRPVSSSSHLQRFNPNIASQGKASNQNQQTNFINYLSNSRDPSIYSTPNGKKMDPKDAGSVEVINNFISPDPKKIVFTNEKIIQESSLENENRISRSGEDIMINETYHPQPEMHMSGFAKTHNIDQTDEKCQGFSP